MHLGMLALLDGLGVFRRLADLPRCDRRLVLRRSRAGQARGSRADGSLRLASLRSAIPHRAAARPTPGPALRHGRRRGTGNVLPDFDGNAAHHRGAHAVPAACGHRDAARSPGRLPGHGCGRVPHGLHLAGVRIQGSGAPVVWRTRQGRSAGRPGRPQLDTRGHLLLRGVGRDPDLQLPFRGGYMSPARCC